MNIATMEQPFTANQLLNLGEQVTIWSVWPVEMKITRPFKTRVDGGFSTDYILPAAPMDAKTPTRLVIGDAIEYQYQGNGKYGENPVIGAKGKSGPRTIAEDLVLHWKTLAIDAKTGAAPGIWIGENTDEARQAAIREQEAYCLVRVALADKAWAANDRGNISSLDHLCAKWLGLDPREHEWMVSEKRGNMTECPVCAKTIPESAMKCEFCGEIVKPEAYAAFQRKREAVLNPIAAEPPKPAPVAPPMQNPARK